MLTSNPNPDLPRAQAVVAGCPHTLRLPKVADFTPGACAHCLQTALTATAQATERWVWSEAADHLEADHNYRDIHHWCCALENVGEFRRRAAPPKEKGDG